MSRVKYGALRAKMSARARRRSEKLYRQHLKEMTVSQMREALELTQEQLAARLETSQVAVSRLESRGDMLLSTLHRVVAAMGGALEIRATFAKGKSLRLARPMRVAKNKKR